MKLLVSNVFWESTSHKNKLNAYARYANKYAGKILRYLHISSNNAASFVILYLYNWKIREKCSIATTWTEFAHFPAQTVYKRFNTALWAMNCSLHINTISTDERFLTCRYSTFTFLANSGTTNILWIQTIQTFKARTWNAKSTSSFSPS